MTSREPIATERFKAGGTLHLDAPSYVVRPADEELFKHVLAGQFCYILTPRQMGKSSLMVRTAERLRNHGFQTAFVDLSGLGTQATSEQWYLGIVKCLAQDLHLAIEPEQWWHEQGETGPVQRFGVFLHDVMLAELACPVVIFIDEIDSMLKLPFSDDFFATIRHTYNQRARDPAYNHLTFVLLGVVAPTDLIQDSKRTPFNIGQAIDLHEFSRSDARPLEEGLEQLYAGQGQRMLNRIFDWTNGHPYLTQKLCREIAEAPVREWTDAEIDRLVAALFLSDDGQKEDNLQFVNHNVEANPERRQLLRLYRRIYAGEAIKEDERAPAQNRLKLIGLVGAKGGRLHVRNEIYRQVFDASWIKQNMPTNRLRIVTWIAIAAVVLTIAAALLYVYQQRQETIALLRGKYLDDIQADDFGAQMYHLGQLCGVEQTEAQRMFFETAPQQQEDLFFAATYGTTTAQQLSAVFDCLAPAIGQMHDHAQLLSAMCSALHNLDVPYDERRERICWQGSRFP